MATKRKRSSSKEKKRTGMAVEWVQFTIYREPPDEFRSSRWHWVIDRVDWREFQLVMLIKRSYHHNINSIADIQSDADALHTLPVFRFQQQYYSKFLDNLVFKDYHSLHEMEQQYIEMGDLYFSGYWNKETIHVCNASIHNLDHPLIVDHPLAGFFNHQKNLRMSFQNPEHIIGHLDKTHVIWSPGNWRYLDVTIGYRYVNPLNESCARCIFLLDEEARFVTYEDEAPYGFVDENTGYECGSYSAPRWVQFIGKTIHTPIESNFPTLLNIFPNVLLHLILEYAFF